MAFADRRTILLVEDNPDDRARLQRMLRGQRRHYAIVECASGAEVMAWLDADHAPVDCMLLDYHLPDVTADELLQRLKLGVAHESIPVCVLTGVDDDDVATRLAAMGAEDYLLKDEITPHALVRAIENVVERSRIRRALDAQRVILAERNQQLEVMTAAAEARLMELNVATKVRDHVVAMMSHEMRTPLSAMLGFVSVLELGGQNLTTEQRRSLERIQSGGKHLLELVNNVLDIAMVEAQSLSLDVKSVEIDIVIKEVAELLEYSANEKGLVLAMRIEQRPLHALADSHRLRQILLNLVGNGIKFTDAGRVEIVARRSDNHVDIEIRVTDSGIGIEALALEHVFQEFFQVNNAGRRRNEGSGLGLAISQRLAQAMGGQITVQSTPNTGSTFLLTLPMYTPRFSDS